jgi:sporulation protein YlmC with PRC-barrel domain
MAGRSYDAGLHLLDRQLVDRDGKLVGKVDDLELEVPEDGAPYVTAILAGPGALAGRVGGRLGAWLEGTANRLRHGDRRRPARISFGVVKAIHSAIDLSAAKADLETSLVDDWVAERIIGKLPGAQGAAD